MKFTLKQVEIQAALGLYLGAQGIDIAGKAVSYAFKSGRGGNGVTVAVDIESENVIGTAATANKLGSTKVRQLTGEALVGDTKPASTVAVVEEVKDVAVAVVEADKTEDTATVEVAAEVTQEVITAAEAAGETAVEVEVAAETAKDETAVQETAPVSTSNIFGD